MPSPTNCLNLAMSILVRDECDVIESNIRFHAAAGVDYFIVTDNGSVDGTRERLVELAREFQIELIDEPSHTIDQDQWVTRMAEHVRDSGSADWLIHNDADEFWCADNGDLKAALQADVATVSGDSVGVLLVPRHNLVASREQALDNSTLFDTVCHSVESTLPLALDARRWNDTDEHILVRTLPGKVITRVDGLESVDYGNHDASHALAQAPSEHIVIHHYPVRSFAQFEKKVRNYGESLAANTRFKPGVSLHLRYWYERYLAGELHDEFIGIHPPLAELQQLVSEGYLIVDESLKGRLVEGSPKAA